MLTSDFDFPFPPDRIALHPAARGLSKLMVLTKSGALPEGFPRVPEKEGWAFGQARDLVHILRAGDALVLNNTKVLRARLHGKLPGGGECEILLLQAEADQNGGAVWECLAKPGRKLKPGTRLAFASGLEAEVLIILPEGERVLRFNQAGAGFFSTLESVGEIPLPPYIRRNLEASDIETYQSVFARNPGSVAAPTASLHLSNELLKDIENKGVMQSYVTLHIGSGTFRPVQSERVEDHPMHSESYSLTQDEADKLNRVRSQGGRIFAVGTTAARVLETCADEKGVLRGQSGETRLFAYPGYRWKTVDALFTNFHWPRSTLFMLVCSMLGTERAKAAYAEALRRDFRLFSYGDAMLIL